MFTIFGTCCPGKLISSVFFMPPLLIYIFLPQRAKKEKINRYDLRVTKLRPELTLKMNQTAKVFIKEVSKTGK